MLRDRVIGGVILVPLVLGAAYLGGLAWLALTLLAGILAWREMAQLLQQAQFTLDRSLGLFFVIGAILEAYASSSGLLPAGLLRPLLAGLIILSLIWALYNKGEHPTADWGITVASALYLGFLLSHFVLLREFRYPDGVVRVVALPPATGWQGSGFAWAFSAVGLTWVYDAMAYLVGSSIGRHRLWPRISPKKSWEGLAGGTAFTLIAGVVAARWLLGLPPWQGLLIGALVSAADPFGDFSVSLFKRMAHCKDSSRLIPGHGGVLDRLDSLLFVFPVVTYLAQLIAR